MNGNMTKQRATELANKINLEGLNKKIKRIVKHPVSLQCEIKLTKGKYNIYINDPVNYVDQIGMMSYVLDSVFIQSRESGYYDRKNKIIIFHIYFLIFFKKIERIRPWLLTATYDFNNNKWEFER